MHQRGQNWALESLGDLERSSTAGPIYGLPGWRMTADGPRPDRQVSGNGQWIAAIPDHRMTLSVLDPNSVVRATIVE